MQETAPSIEAAVVTGAGRGIGKQLALTLAATGVEILCVARSASCEATRDEIRANGGRAESAILDLADYEEAERCTRGWLETVGRRKLGAVLAAAQLGPSGPLLAEPLSAWEETFRVNVLGNLAVARSLLEAMMERRFGRIVFLAGGGAAYGYPSFPAYACTKAALARVVENLGLDLASKGDIAVVYLAPGAVETDMLAKVRSAGGDVRTTTDVSEAVDFVHRFLADQGLGLSGRYVHVRDDWDLLQSAANAENDLWTLRRVE